MNLINTHKQTNLHHEETTTKAQIQRHQEEYVKRMRDKENSGQKYIEELIMEKFYKLDAEEKEECRDLFGKFTQGSHSKI